MTHHVPYEGGYRVSQHFMDALERETNTVVTAVFEPGSAKVPDCVTTGPRTSETTSYPDGTSDYSIHTDPRGVRTVTTRTSHDDREVTETPTFSPTNLVNPVILSRNIHHRNGASESYTEWDGQWTRETSWTEYTSTGLQRDIAVSESSDSGAFTNRVTVSDFLGRIVSISTPGANGTTLTTQHVYDGISSRISQSTMTDSPTVTYVYDELQNRVATVRNGTAVWSGTKYETIGNEIWEIGTQSRVTDGATNGVTVTRRQVTGLTGGLRSRTASIATCGSVTVEERSFDSATRRMTTTSWTDDATPSINVSMFGHAVSDETIDERTESYFDPHGRVCLSETYHPISNALIHDYRAEFDISGNIVYHEAHYGDDIITEHASYDAWNRETSRTDTHGETIYKTYDAAGRPVSVDGASYPTRANYDTAGRKTSSLTTRDDGTTWDTTQWHYDPRTGLNTSKVYANLTSVEHSYTANGKPERTTWARGAWKEIRYDDRNQISSNIYASTATPSVYRTYTQSGKTARVTDDAGTDYQYVYNANLALTSETVVIGSRTFGIVRTVDDHEREAHTSVSLTNAVYAVKMRSFDCEGRLAGLALTNVHGRGVSVIYGYDGSFQTNCTVVLQNGAVFRRALTRNASRRTRVNRHDYAFNGSTILWHACARDLLGRVTNAVDSLSVVRDFSYNNRSEIMAANIGTNRYGYLFDTIGNRQAASENSATNIYTANSLNQYANVNNATLTYDADGNLLFDGVRLYAYDDENRLVSATPTNLVNGSVRTINRYDYRHRRTEKQVEMYVGGTWQFQRVHTFVYDGWNPVIEMVDYAGGTSRTFEYFWGNDLSGTEQGAGGIGGLLAVSIDGSFYVPCYDHNGNVTAFIGETGTPVAQYTYGAFGNTVEQSGAMAGTFSLLFSTKCFDVETGMYYYGRRFYTPGHGRWLNRDPIEERGGENLYAFCRNNSLCY